MATAMLAAGPGLRERKKQETSDRILAAAFELFNIRGYEETTLHQIAERAGVAPRTVSNYFPVKADILVAYRAGMLAVLEEALRRTRNHEALVRVRAALIAVSRENERHPSGRLAQNLLARHASYAALERIQERFRRDLVVTLDGCTALRPGVDLEMAVLALSSSFLAVVQRWASEAGGSLAADAGRLFDLWAAGATS